MRIDTYLNSANRVTLTHSFLITTIFASQEFTIRPSPLEGEEWILILKHSEKRCWALKQELSYLEHRLTGILAEDSMLSKLGNKLISQHLCLVQSSSDSVSYCADRRRVGSCPLCWNPWSPSLDPTCCPAPE
uniref:Uncharacterized protein n=1 Tax=Magallana gigas TaxID=29159 RepID=K1RWA0_MAGGI